MPEEILYTELDLRHRRLADGHFWLYAVGSTSRRVVGCLSMADQGTEWAWIQSVYVDPGFRRRGIARHLVMRAIEIAPAMVMGNLLQCQGVCAGIDAHNTASIALFEQLGFRWVYTYPDQATRLYSYRRELPDGQA